MEPLPHPEIRQLWPPTAVPQSDRDGTGCRSCRGAPTCRGLGVTLLRVVVVANTNTPGPGVEPTT